MKKKKKKEKENTLIQDICVTGETKANAILDHCGCTKLKK